MTLILIQNTVCNFLLFAKTNTTESYAQLVTRINPAPVDAGLFFLVFRAPAPLHFDNETARDKRAQSRSTPGREHPPSTGAADGWGEGLNGISVNASFEWIFDCVVYDWIYFLPAPAFFLPLTPAEFRKSQLHFICTECFLFFFLISHVIVVVVLLRAGLVCFLWLESHSHNCCLPRRLPRLRLRNGSTDKQNGIASAISTMRNWTEDVVSWMETRRHSNIRLNKR